MPKRGCFMSLTVIVLIVVSGIVALGIGLVVGMFVRKGFQKREAVLAEVKSRGILAEAESRAKAIQKEAELTARDQIFKSRMELEQEEKKRRLELSAIEKRILVKEENFDRKVETLDRRDTDFRRSEQLLESKRVAVDELEKKHQGQMEEARRLLEQLSGMSAEEAKKMLVEKMTADATHEAAKRIKLVEDEAKESADKKAKKIISLAI